MTDIEILRCFDKKQWRNATSIGVGVDRLERLKDEGLLERKTLPFGGKTIPEYDWGYRIP